MGWRRARPEPIRQLLQGKLLERLSMATGGSPTRSRPLVVAALCAVVGIVATAGDAAAQWWPWGKQDDGPPVPREGMRPKGLPPGQLPPLQPGPPAAQPPPFGSRVPSNICLQLEQRLVAEVQGSGQGRELLPKIETDMRDLERAMRSASFRLERSDCWDTFLFSKTLRPSARCRQLNNEVESARQRLADLDRQRRQIMGTGDRSLQDEIIRELARNGCGEQYAREARKRDVASNPFALLFGGGEDTEAPRGPANQFGTLPFATYRTLCVRLCDGYYFPVSFSTLPNHFQRDAQLCQSHCAAPAELFYHQNPGGAVEQMVSFSSQQPYTSLKTAFRYRKEYVQGCSCKQAEYNPAVETLEKKAEAPPPQAPAAPAAGIRIGAKR
jgi:hypothetical protein